MVAAEHTAALSGARRGSNAISVRVVDVLATSDAALAPVRRWFSIRHPDGSGALTETFGQAALKALADLTGITVAQCRDRLIDRAGAGG